jgi:hypothetical protein
VVFGELVKSSGCRDPSGVRFGWLFFDNSVAVRVAITRAAELGDLGESLDRWSFAVSFESL